MPDSLALAAARLVTGGVERADVVVEVAAGRVTAVRPQRAGEAYDVRLPDDAVLAPGLVDAQINGVFGVDFIAATPDEWAMTQRRLPETGVTAFLPTFITATVEELVQGLKHLAAAREVRAPGARILGAHLEGPFLAQRRRGAHNAAHLRDPDPAAVEALLDAGPPGTVALVTLAPELPGALDAIRRLTEAGVVVSVGHSDATGEQVGQAVEAGARMVTHLFNAQRPLHHREPGVVGRALADSRLLLGLIVDLHHVVPDVVRLVWQAAADRVVLVTDAVAAAGMPPGRYDLGGEPVVVEPGRPPMREDGSIAGSGLSLDQAIRNCVDLGVPLARAVDAASRRPADLLGRTELGRVEPGAVADLVWLDAALRPRATWVAGELVHGEVPAG